MYAFSYLYKLPFGSFCLTYVVPPESTDTILYYSLSYGPFQKVIP